MNNNIEALHKSAQIAINEQQYQQAHQYLLQILQQDKYFADAYFLLAMIASVHSNNVKAIQLIEQSLKLSPDNPEYLAQLAKHHALENNHVNAVDFAKQAAKLTITSALTLDTIGVAYSQIGLHQHAVPFFKKAVELDGENPTFYFNLGASLKFVGDFSGAREAYEKTIALAPMHCKAHSALTSLGGITQDDNHIDTLETLYTTISHPDDKLYIGHALAREYESLGNFDKAFSVLSSVKQNKLTTLNYDIGQDKEMFASLHSYFDESPFDKRMGFDSREPIFVVGMPRTGTTLVERIVSQHSDVTGAGELQHFGLLLKQLSQTKTSRVIDTETITAASNVDFNRLGESYIESTRAITGKTAKFVDKMPLNVLYAGFIMQALPNAKILCLDRNPLDTIVSNFRQLFAVNYSYYNYAYSLKSTAEFYVLFEKLVKHWQSNFNENFYVINYEKLVNDPEIEARKIIDFCGLDWQAQCLDINENSSPVATASAVQVRQPINNKSVGNWRKYEHYLDDVISYLKTQGVEL